MRQRTRRERKLTSDLIALLRGRWPKADATWRKKERGVMDLIDAYAAEAIDAGRYGPLRETGASSSPPEGVTR